MRVYAPIRAAKRNTSVDVVLRHDAPEIPAGKEHQYVAFHFGEVA